MTTTATGFPWVWSDGGRAAAGFRGTAPGDCATRAIALATDLPYRDVYNAINRLARRHERPDGRGKRSSARHGVRNPTWRRYLESLGWVWVPTMRIGSGCTVHLRPGELPDDRGRLVVSVSRHLVAVIGGHVWDLFDPSRDGTRCVYGYFYRPGA